MQNTFDRPVLVPTKGNVTFPEIGPHFIGIGAQKSATTWLFKMLSMHSKVYFPRGKEIHFWDKDDVSEVQISRYVNTFRMNAAKAFQGINGEITPGYFVLPAERIRLIAEAAPKVRLLFIARNPVKRAVSAADFNIKFRSRRDRSFEQVLFSQPTINYGLYMKYLPNWLLNFDRSQLLVILQDDICDNPRKVMREVSAHLHLDPGIWNDVPEKYLRSLVNSALEKTAISAEAEAELKSLYRKDVEMFSEFLGRDLTSWIQ
jgi:Sulfotransferase domain